MNLEPPAPPSETFRCARCGATFTQRPTHCPNCDDARHAVRFTPQPSLARSCFGWTFVFFLLPTIVLVLEMMFDPSAKADWEMMRAPILMFALPGAFFLAVWLGLVTFATIKTLFFGAQEMERELRLMATRPSPDEEP